LEKIVSKRTSEINDDRLKEGERGEKQKIYRESESWSRSVPMASCGISYPAFHSDLVPDDNERAGSLLLDPRHRGDGGRRRTAHCHYPTNWESKSFCQLSVRAMDEAKRHQR